jgi:hypothetical protein
VDTGVIWGLSVLSPQFSVNLKLLQKNVLTYLKKKKKRIASRVHWLMPIILVTQEAEINRMEFEASPGKKSTRPHLNQ